MKDKDIRALAERYHIALIYLFGSQADKGRGYLEGEEVMPEAFSDLDIAIAFENSPAEAIKIYGILYKEFSERNRSFYKGLRREDQKQVELLESIAL
jgi:predicted nucleotidyltransferase